MQTKFTDLISIVIPAYNIEKHIEKCLFSVLKQTYTNLEIIVVNDGSTDNTELLAKQFCYDKRVLVYSKENGGLSSSRNFGIENAHGKYICFIDGDDYIDEYYIEKMYNAIIKHNADMAICNFFRISEDGKILFKTEYTSNNTTINQEEFWNKCYHYTPNYYAWGCVAWNKLYRIEIFEKLRYDVDKYHEDEFILHKIIDKCHKIICIDDALYCYVARSTSIIATKNLKKYIDSAQAALNRSIYFANNHSKYLKNSLIHAADSISAIYFLKPNKNNIQFKYLKKQYKKLVHKTNIKNSGKTAILLRLFILFPRYMRKRIFL